MISGYQDLTDIHHILYIFTIFIQSIGGSSLKIVKLGPLTLQGGRVVQGRRLESPSSCGLRTLQGGRVVLGKFVACTGHCGVHSVAADKLTGQQSILSDSSW